MTTNETTGADSASALTNGLGAVMTYSVRRIRGVCGQTIGADGSGKFCTLIYGTPEEAWKYALDFLNSLAKQGLLVEQSEVVLNEEGWGGPVIRAVSAPNVEFSGAPAALSPEAPLERRVMHRRVSDGEI